MEGLTRVVDARADCGQEEVGAVEQESEDRQQRHNGVRATLGARSVPRPRRKAHRDVALRRQRHQHGNAYTCVKTSYGV